jgi:hypothetical protein
MVNEDTVVWLAILIIDLRAHLLAEKLADWHTTTKLAGNWSALYRSIDPLLF